MMTTNRIQDIRADISRYFDGNGFIPGTEEIHYSPDRNYFFRSACYRQTCKNRNWTVSKIQLFQMHNQEKLFEYIRNDDSLFHGWLTNEGKTYLYLSEDLEGKSIFSFADRQFYSYSFEADTFIWCEYFPSPNGKRLAVIGCHWACPYELVVFDTSNPADYPYRELYRQDTFREKIEWSGDQALTIFGEAYSKTVDIA